MLPISGRLTDRIGGGPMVLAGVIILALATVPLAFVSDHTPYALLGAVLFVRGLGLGASIQPTAAAAYAMLDSSQVPRATAALNMLRQIGASIGTALLAVVLQHESKAALLAPLSASEREQISGPVATAFAHTFMWGVALALLAILPAVALLRAERAERRSSTVAGADRLELQGVRQPAHPRTAS
jgi:MFS family permease